MITYLRNVLTKLNTTDEEQINLLERIDQTKMNKRLIIQSRRRCFVAKTRESLGPYWVPRYGPRCTAHIDANHATVPLKTCHPEHIQSHFRVEEEKLVDQLGSLIHELGISRFEMNQAIPVDFESIETMIDILGKKKRRSLIKATDGTRLMPEEGFCVKFFFDNITCC